MIPELSFAEALKWDPFGPVRLNFHSCERLGVQPEIRCTNLKIISLYLYVSHGMKKNS